MSSKSKRGRRQQQKMQPALASTAEQPFDNNNNNNNNPLISSSYSIKETTEPAAQTSNDSTNNFVKKMDNKSKFLTNLANKVAKKRGKNRLIRSMQNLFMYDNKSEDEIVLGTNDRNISNINNSYKQKSGDSNSNLDKKTLTDKTNNKSCSITNLKEIQDESKIGKKLFVS